MEFLDFDIKINKNSEKNYKVEVRSPAGEAENIMTFPYDREGLLNRLHALEIALLRSGGERRRSLLPEEQTVKKFGEELFCLLIDGEILIKYDGSRLIARQEGKGLRIRLRLQPPELAAMPWEFLCDKRHDYLSLSNYTPIIRYLESSDPIPRLRVNPPLRILGMVASPDELTHLDAKQEQQRIDEAIKNLKAKGLLDLVWLKGQTWNALLEEITLRSNTYHVFHFIGHGGFDRDMNEGILVFSDENGKKDVVAATQLSRLLANHQSLRLVFLNSCEGAVSNGLDIYSSTAAKLVKHELPAVLAMQYAITDKAALEFSKIFYTALAYGQPIDTAVTIARLAINKKINNSLEWGTPVLYMRSTDGDLFDLPVPPKAHLRVETDPKEAKIRNLSVSTEFTQGMELEPGTYCLEISAANYETKQEWVELEAGEDHVKKISLQQEHKIIPWLESLKGALIGALLGVIIVVILGFKILGSSKKPSIMFIFIWGLVGMIEGSMCGTYKKSWRILMGCNLIGGILGGLVAVLVTPTNNPENLSENLFFYISIGTLAWGIAGAVSKTHILPMIGAIFGTIFGFSIGAIYGYKSGKVTYAYGFGFVFSVIGMILGSAGGKIFEKWWRWRKLSQTVK